MPRRQRSPTPPKLRRGRPKHLPRVKITIVCEGTVTEPKYLREFVRDHGNNLVELIIDRGAGVPTTIVDKAIEIQRRQRRDARREADGFSKGDQTWAMFDVDQHPNLQNTRTKAVANKIYLAISNPCFELWPLIHFQDQDGEINRHAAQRRLHDLMPSYHPNGSKEIDYPAIRGRLAEAKQRAQDQRRRRGQEDNAGGNPSTTADLLLDVIVANGQRWRHD